MRALEPTNIRKFCELSAFTFAAFFAHPLLIKAALPSLNEIEPILEKRCIECHDSEDPKGGLDLVKLSRAVQDPSLHERWVRIHDRIKAGEMPPKREDLPDSERAVLAAILAKALHASDRADIIRQGRGPMRRLTRTEFENNLRILLKLPNLDVRDKLPEDRDSHGFTKVSELLDMSHVQLDAYLEATESALRSAMAQVRPPAPPATHRFTGINLFPSATTFGEREAMFFARNNRLVPLNESAIKTMTPEERSDPTLELALFRSATWPYYGYPRGFIAKESGAYQVRFRGRAVRQMRDFRLVQAHEPLPMTFRARKPSGPDVSGDVRETGGWMDLQPDPHEFETIIHLKAGETFEYSPLGLPVPFIRTDGGFFYDYPPMPPEGHRGVAIQWMEVTGPIRDPDWPPQSHRILFDDAPIDGRGAPDADRLLRRFAALAALRPMSEESLAPFLKIIQSKLAAGSLFGDAMIAGYQALLCSSHCLYLTEPRAGASDIEFAIANRLSHFFWNSRPDDKLQELAKSARLQNRDILKAQADRLIEDSRFEEFVRTFAAEWLDLRKLRRDIPDERLYPEYRKDDYLVDSMERETQAFLRAMVRENLPARTIASADFAYVNDRLAAHYDLPRVKGSAMQRVNLPEGSPFGGLLTQAGLMKHTANGTTTSPVLRGVWIMEKILGQPVPPPPKNVPAIEPDIRGANSIRALLAKHTESKSCASCHAKFDPFGFAMENFDVMGAWRDHYRGMERGDKITGIDPAGHPYTYFVGKPVDASGTLQSGESFRDIHDLKRHLAANPRQLAKGLLEHFILHATGTRVRFADRTELEAMLDACAGEGYRVRDLLHALVTSEIFLGTKSSP